MLDLIKKGLETAIGGLSETQDKLKELADELVLKGHLTGKEGDALIKELKGTVKESRKKLTSFVDEQVRNVLKEVGVATRSDIKALKGRIEELEKALKKESKEKTAAKKNTKKKSEVKKEKKEKS